MEKRNYFIGLCNDETEREVFESGFFGTSNLNKFRKVKNAWIGFLYNFKKRKLVGIFESQGRYRHYEDYEKEGWKIPKFVKEFNYICPMKRLHEMEEPLPYKFLREKFGTRHKHIEGEVEKKFYKDFERIFKKYCKKQSYLENLLFDEVTQSSLFHALRTKGFVFLAGLTGTGKTKLAMEMARMCAVDESSVRFISVRPDWTDSSALLGWYNPIEGKFREGLVLRFILEAAEDYKERREDADPHFLILDEMNLAHIEHYFADFLSVLETGRDQEGWTEERIRLGVNPKSLEEDLRSIVQGLGDLAMDEGEVALRLPPNLYIIGTLNTDETTKSLSPKVLDRGFTLEFWEVKLEDYPPSPEVEKTELSELVRKLSQFKHPLGKDGPPFLSHIGNKSLINEAVREFRSQNEELWDHLQNLNRSLASYDLHFGYRVVDEIVLFVNAATSEGSDFKLEPKVALDVAVCAKVLPKFSGTRARLERPLRCVIAWTVNGEVDSTKLSDLDGLDWSSELGVLEDEVLRVFGKTKENSYYRYTLKKALRMLRRAREEGFTSYF